MFKKTRERALLARIEKLSESLAATQGALAARTESLGIAEEYERAKKELTDLQVTVEKVKEGHQKERREIEHKIGLHKIQVEQETKTARKEAELAVREESLAAQKTQFEDQMKFMSDRMSNEIQAQRDLMEKILSRLPSFERSHQTVEHIGVQPAVQITKD